MKQQFTKFALGLILLSTLKGFSQESKLQPCNTYAAMEAYFNAVPGSREKFEASQKQLEKERFDYKNLSAKASAFVYTVPVVFHILHTGGSENITDAQCIAALAQVNRDYAREGADTGTIAMPFKSRYINSDIQFMLAHKDPSGNCTNGIEHKYDVKTAWDQANTGYYSGIAWDPTKYLNIIIVKNIIPSQPVVGGGIIVGYTHLPGTVGTGSAADVIVYNYNYLGGLDARSLSHEIGHWFNLSHTFGNTNNPGSVCGDDGIFDTPPTKGNFNACPNSATGNLCSSTTSVYAAGQQNTENIMDYSNCPKNFTMNQTTAMRSALASTVGNRQNLWQTTNLVATDVNATSPCAPKSEYLTTTGTYTVCTGSGLTFKDFSYNGTITSYNWSTSSSGAVIASPNASITGIVFNTIGTVNVSLTVSNAQGSSTKIRQVDVRDGTAAITGQFFESFENDTVPLNWVVKNPNPGSARWQQTDQAHYDGFHSFMVEGANCLSDQVDILETPIMDVLHNTEKTFTIAVAYAQSSASYTDQLMIDGSNDCGGSWKNITSFSGSQMRQNSGGIDASPWFPQFKADWKVYDIATFPNWTSDFINSPNVKIRFSFLESKPGQGNNIFIDAINMFSVYDGVGINELTKKYSFFVYPNPTKDEANIRFTLSDNATVKLAVFDVLGKEVETLVNTDLKPGEQNLLINKNNSLSKGIYIVNLNINGTVMTKKLVIN